MPVINVASHVGAVGVHLDLDVGAQKGERRLYVAGRERGVTSLEQLEVLLRHPMKAPPPGIDRPQGAEARAPQPLPRPAPVPMRSGRTERRRWRPRLQPRSQPMSSERRTIRSAP